MSHAPSEVAFHGWLAAVTPAGARRFRTCDPHLAATLLDAGADVVDRGADVGVGHLGAEPTLLFPLGTNARLRGSAVRRAVCRVSRAAQLRRSAAAVARETTDAGYSSEIFLWDFFQRVSVPGVPDPPPARLADRFPLHAVVRGVRGPRGPSAFDAALVDARRATGRDLAAASPFVASGVLVMLSERDVFRCVIGPFGRSVGAAPAAVAALQAETLAQEISTRLPVVHATGRAGLADWAVESRLPGRHPSGQLAPGLLAECLDFLVALHRVRPAAPPRSLVEAAREVVPDGSLSTHAHAADDALREVPRGFAHGDFWGGNLLCSDRGGLTGVIDWDAAGPGALPLLDLVNLRLRADHPASAERWGPALLSQVLPEMRAGGDRITREYCERVGVVPGPRVLEALTVAYWLERAAYHLRRDPMRRASRSWFRDNVAAVAAGLSR